VWNRTPLHRAASENRVDVAKQLLENSANVHGTDNDGNTALHIAAYWNRVDAARLLLRYSAHVDRLTDDGQTALHWAAGQNSVDVAKLLLAKSANFNARVVSGYYKGLTPLQLAEFEDHKEMVELLRNAAKDCAFHRDCGTTQACSQRKCINLCFSAKCSYKGVNNARDIRGWTPLHLAASENRIGAAKLLLENSADVDSTANNGWTALHWAAYKNSVALASHLLFYWANVDSADKWGKTALHNAAWRNSVDVARLLLAKSANLNATAVSGWARGLTPLQVAERFGNQRMVRLLRNA